MRMEGLRERTKQFALRVIRVHAALPKSEIASVLGRQLLRAGTSVAANFREASRARSNAEFVSKLGIVEQELDETILWLELIVESACMPARKLTELNQEADEILRIVVSAAKRTKQRN